MSPCCGKSNRTYEKVKAEMERQQKVAGMTRVNSDRPIQHPVPGIRAETVQDEEFVPSEADFSKYEEGLDKDSPTVELQALRHGAKFVWGEIQGWVFAGPYTLAYYLDKHDQKPMWYIWVDEQPTAHVALSIEGALSEAMAYKHDGPNSQASRFFMRMLGLLEG